MLALVLSQTRTIVLACAGVCTRRKCGVLFTTTGRGEEPRREHSTIVEGQRLGRHRHVHTHIHIHVHFHVRVVVPSHVVCRALLVGWLVVVWCGVVWCGVVWCGVVWCGVVWCGVVWCGVVWCGVVWCGVVWCGVVMLSFCIVFLSFCRPVANLAVTPPSLVAVVLLVSCSRLAVAVSSCGGPCLKSVPVSYDKYIATGKSGAFNDRARLVLKMGKIRRLFGEPLGNVITLCGQTLVSSAGGDFFFLCVVCWRRGEEGVCTFKTSPCVPAPRAHVEKHVDVVPCTRGRFECIHGGVSESTYGFFHGFSACRTPNTPRPPTTATTTQTTDHTTHTTCVVYTPHP